MIKSKTYPIFSGGSRTIRWYTYDDNKVTVEANSVSARVLDMDRDVLNTLSVTRENVGVYSTVIDTTSLGLDVGTYIIEFSCIVLGQNKRLRDYIKVKYML
jgi:hypothetical protein